MKTLNLGIDYLDGKPVTPGVLNGAELTYDYINFAVVQKYKDGLDGQLRRIWGRIQNKLEIAVKDKAKTIELEEAEYDFIVKAFQEAKYAPHLAKFVNILEVELDKAKNI